VPIPANLLADAQVVGPLGSLAFSCRAPLSSSLALRAVAWHAGLTRLGVNVPFFVAHDLGLALAVPADQVEAKPRVPESQLPPAAKHLLAPWAALVSELAKGEVPSRAAELRLTDDLVVVLLARVLAPATPRLPPPGPPARIPLDGSIFEGLDATLPRLVGAVDRRRDLETLSTLVGLALALLTVADAIDIDTLRLFGLLGAEASAGALAQVDMLSALSSPEANDVVNFSLELLPSVLETKPRMGSGTRPAHGYSGLTNRGSFDSLVLTELAWDDLELARRLLENEVLYFAREEAREDDRRVHTLLVDASASMRGDRQTFARGMVIATAKQILLEGEDVVVRFFDSRIYEPLRAPAGQLPVAQILAFRGERGRNPARVFTQLASELTASSDTRVHVVHLFTHAALYAPRELVQAVTQVAHVQGVFILPSGGKLELDYLDLLASHWVIDHRTLASSNDRAEAALAILDDRRAESAPHSAGGGPLSVGPRSQARSRRSRGAAPNAGESEEPT
jgi:hypothetical protein